MMKVAEAGETVVSVVEEAPDYVLKARRKSQLAKELMDDKDLVFIWFLLGVGGLVLRKREELYLACFLLYITTIK